MYSEAIRVQTSAALVFEQQRPGLDLVALEGREHHRRRRRRGDAEGQQRHQDAGGRGVVGRLRSGDALDGALAELCLVGALGQLPLGRVGQEGGDVRAAGRDRADREADEGSAQPRLPGPLPVLLGHPGVLALADRDELHGAVPQLARRRTAPRRAAKRPTATRTMSTPSTRVGLSNVKRCWAVLSSMPIRPMNSPRAREARPRRTEAPSSAPTVRKATTISAT